MPIMRQLLADLNRLLTRGEPWVWGHVQQAAHNAVKEVFNREGLVLHYMNYHKQLIPPADFPNPGLGAVLVQLDEDGNEYICTCISRFLNRHEANYISYKGRCWRL